MTAAHFAPAASWAAAGWRLEVGGGEEKEGGGGGGRGDETGLHLLVTEPTHGSCTGCSVPVLTTFGLKNTE